MNKLKICLLICKSILLKLTNTILTSPVFTLFLLFFPVFSFLPGFVSGFVQEYDERDRLDYSCPKKGMVAELIVDKNCRANGIGTELLKHIENYFKSIDCEFVQIDVFAYNEPAKKFYYKNGYEDRMITVFKKL